MQHFELDWTLCTCSLNFISAQQIWTSTVRDRTPSSSSRSSAARRTRVARTTFESVNSTSSIWPEVSGKPRLARRFVNSPRYFRVACYDYYVGCFFRVIASKKPQKLTCLSRHWATSFLRLLTESPLTFRTETQNSRDSFKVFIFLFNNNLLKILLPKRLAFLCITLQIRLVVTLVLLWLLTSVQLTGTLTKV